MPSKPSHSKLGGQNIVEKNRRAVIQGVTTPAQMNEWHRNNSVQKRIVKGTKRNSRNCPPVPQGTCYGRPSKESMHVPDLMGGMKGNTNVLNMPDNSYAPGWENQGKPGRLPLPRPTHSSDICKKHNKQTLESKSSTSSWQMKKFMAIGPKIDKYGKPRPTYVNEDEAAISQDLLDAELADLDAAEAANAALE